MATEFSLIQNGQLAVEPSSSFLSIGPIANATDVPQP